MKSEQVDSKPAVLDQMAYFEEKNSRFAHKLRTAGRLLEFVCIPGAKHGSGMMPQFR